MKKIALINVGFGNISSVINSLNRIEIKSQKISSGQELLNYGPSHIIMPGVGAVGQAMKKLKDNNFIEPLDYFVNKKKTFFCGICVGMQVLSSYSDEFGINKCLGWIPGKVELLSSNGLSLPHMGWNTLKKKNSSVLLNNLYEKDMYFCHSYALKCENKYITAETEYGKKFVSSVNKENIFGIQCHPEKSLGLGDIFFNNFYNLGESHI